ncbi:MAG TPA: FAD-dependent oxidoreductase, partial [Terrimicrobiaceae bacterium]|nr:FAD-dependent oxidoreductase [Terrimicrobiaceae bacterium]
MASTACGWSASEKADLVVYGGTPAGIAAAVQADRMKKSVILIEPGKYLGGMMTGGLGATDKGVVTTVGGVAKEFFQRIYRQYLDPAAWTFESRESYVPKHGQILTEPMQAQWYFEPKMATKVFDEMLKETQVKVVKNQCL